MSEIHRYRGPGRYYGIPARDLTAAEVDALPVRQQVIVRTSGAWQAGDSGALADRTRDELNEMATRAGVDDPAALPNKAAVVKAIEQASKDGER